MAKHPPHITKGRYIVEVRIDGVWTQKDRTNDSAAAGKLAHNLEILPHRPARVRDTQKRRGRR